MKGRSVCGRSKPALIRSSFGSDQPDLIGLIYRGWMASPRRINTALLYSVSINNDPVTPGFVNRKALGVWVRQHHKRHLPILHLIHQLGLLALECPHLGDG